MEDLNIASFSMRFVFAVYSCIVNTKTKNQKSSGSSLSPYSSVAVSRLKPAAPSEGPAVLESPGACLQTVLFASSME